MMAFQVNGWGLIIPITIYEPASLTNTEMQYQVFDDTGVWQNAGDAIIYDPGLGGFNTFVHITAGGTYTTGHAYLCKVGMKLS